MTIMESATAPTTSAAPKLSLRGVSKSYRDAKGNTTSVLDGLDLDVQDGEFVAILGFSLSLIHI